MEYELQFTVLSFIGFFFLLNQRISKSSHKSSFSAGVFLLIWLESELVTSGCNWLLVDWLFFSTCWWCSCWCSFGLCAVYQTITKLQWSEYRFSSSRLYILLCFHQLSGWTIGLESDCRENHWLLIIWAYFLIQFQAWFLLTWKIVLWVQNYVGFRGGGGGWDKTNWVKINVFMENFHTHIYFWRMTDFRISHFLYFLTILNISHFWLICTIVIFKN